MAVTQLGDGTPAADGTSCKFTFSFGYVKQTATFYSVEVGRRGKVTDSADQLTSNYGQFELTIGP